VANFFLQPDVLPDVNQRMSLTVQ